MKQLSNIQTYIFLFGAFIMVIGAGLKLSADFFLLGSASASGEILSKTGACLFLLGTLCFALMQISQSYEGDNLAIKRLRNIQIICDIACILSVLLLIEHTFRIIYPIMSANGYYSFYVQYINNNWVVYLLIAAVLEVYTMHRIANLIKKT